MLFLSVSKCETRWWNGWTSNFRCIFPVIEYLQTNGDGKSCVHLSVLLSFDFILLLVHPFHHLVSHKFSVYFSSSNLPFTHRSHIILAQIYQFVRSVVEDFTSCCPDYSNAAEHILWFDRGCEWMSSKCQTLIRHFETERNNIGIYICTKLYMMKL
jgi:hypothetical protein